MCAIGVTSPPLPGNVKPGDAMSLAGTSLDTEPARHAFAHKARFGEIAALAGRNALLGLVTLTLYRFWARTRMRRRLWARTELLGDPLEYTGKGGELFRGFLLSLPTFFLPAIFVLYLAPLAFDPATAGLMFLAFYAVAVPLINAARYWMRRYQLSRTRWRGIRLSLEGSGWAYAWASIGWSLLEAITLGWFHPVARMRRAQLLWSNTRFGDQPFAFTEAHEDLARGLYGPYALAWIGTPIAFFGAFVLGGFIAASAGYNPTDITTPLEIALSVAAFASLFVLAFLLVLLVWAPFNAAAMNRTAALLTIDGAHFELRATTFGLYGVTIASVLIFALSLGFMAPLAGALYVRYVFNRLTMIGQPRFAEIGQSIVPEEKAGEGIADAFDLDLGVGVV